MSAYHAARAAELLGLESLPDRLTVEEIAALQVHDERLPESRLSEGQSPFAEIFRVLQRATIADTWCKAMQAAIDAGELRQAGGKISAAEFKRWLDVQGDPPSLLIKGWFAVQARGRKKWTPKKLAELRAFRDEHGTKAAVERFGISRTRISQLLPTEKPPADWLMPEMRTKRGR